MVAKYKNALSVRGDSLYCPLSLSLDAYWNCLEDCNHCSFRSLNHVWGQDLRPADPEAIRKKLINGLKNKNPQSKLAHCLKNKNTIRFGSRTDPFQNVEDEYQVSAEILKIFYELEWSYAVQTKFPNRLYTHKDLLKTKKELFTLIIVMSPGWNKDWEILERKRTEKPKDRLKIAKKLISKNYNVGVNGEPFIPGYHTIDDFEFTLNKLKQYGIPSYNTYNFHFNPHVAKRLNSIGIDIEKIWYYNQDEQWKPILQKLLELSKKYKIRLGVPDFVNTGTKWKEKANTCCGVNVPNPTTFNTHYFKKLKQKGKSAEVILKNTYDGSGNYDEGCDIVKGKGNKFYTLRDCGFKNL